MKEYKIASIAGDGIGKEVRSRRIKSIKRSCDKSINLKFILTEFDFASCDYHAKHGKMLPDDWKEQIGKHDAIFFGAVGMPDQAARSYFFMGIFT